MSNRTTRVLKLLDAASDCEFSITSATQDVADCTRDLHGSDPARRNVVARDKARAEHQVRRWSIKRDKFVLKLRALFAQLEAHEQQHFLEHNDSQLDWIGVTYRTFLCEQIDGNPPTLRFWCPFCREHHVYGMPPGHRVADCSSAEGKAAFPHGYVLKLKEESER
jgi:hypothetical protein